MKTIPPPCPEPETGRRYWRGLDELSDTPEFREWVAREFPAGASEFSDPVSRRHFVQIMSSSFLLAGLGLAGGGCRRPEEKILPFGKMPEGYVHGVAQFFATSFPSRGAAIPLVVRSHEGRPVKVEGNDQHPDSIGSTDLFAQASLLNLYDADRAQHFRQSGNTVAREKALDFLGTQARGFAANGGAGLNFLMERSASPSRDRLQSALALKYPSAKWFIYEPVDFDLSRLTASALTTRPVRPYYKMDAAKVVVSLDCDFIGGEEEAYRLIRGYAKGRRIAKPGDAMNRLYTVEALMSLAGINADHRLRVPASQVLAIAVHLATQAAPENNALRLLASRLALPQGVDPKWVTECAADLAANKGQGLVLAGQRQPVAVHVIANVLNAALGNVGKTVQFFEASRPASGYLADLASALNNGQVDTLVILGGNPAYNAPADLDWANTQRKAKTVIRLGYYEDETSAQCDWHLPAAHFLESWGDARTADGTFVPVQPLLRPLFDGLTELEVLARLGGLTATRPYDIARETFDGELQRIGAAGNLEESWKKFLHDGFLAKSAAAPIDVAFAPDRVTAALATARAQAAPSTDSLEVVFYRDAKVDDGRWNNNGWMLELPDPVTKITWDNVVLISRRTAEELGVKNKDVVEIELGSRKIQGPIWIQPGLADNTLGLALGYGRQQTAKGGTGRVGHGVGFNAYALRPASSENFASGAHLRKTGQTYPIAVTQEHNSMEGRPIIREANADQFQAHPNFAKRMDLEAHDEFLVKTGPVSPIDKAVNGAEPRPTMIYEHPYRAYETRKEQSGVDLSNKLFSSNVHQWGMSIDLNSCVGCAACVIACQSENNIPIVGKDQVIRNREMQWMRIDRYYSGARESSAKDQIDDPQAVVQPMLCQHCENAPCESVCPVNATVHDEEGLNVMAYNRCVGTRYCSNNCPYKVRRFNFFDYNKRSLDQLKGPYYGSPITTARDGEWNLLRWWKNPDLAYRPDDEWELLKLVKNPDVSVRMRGVMEKCTFCVQRIEGAKIQQKVKAGQSGDVQVPEGAFKTACQQACPAEAIVFGNLLDPNSKVSQLKKQERDYAVLGFLDTRPRLTYLARVRNPNKRMPDYHEVPLNIDEYFKESSLGEPHADSHADPYAEHGGHHEAHAGAEAAPVHAEQKGAK